MYIEKYWRNYIGGTDDSLNLVAFLADQQQRYRLRIPGKSLPGYRLADGMSVRTPKI